MDRAEVPHSGWHQLRHTAATLLAAAGTDVATIGRILGHRPGSVVTLRYLHTDDDRLRQAADAVAELRALPEGEVRTALHDFADALVDRLA
jgi:integrase